MTNYEKIMLELITEKITDDLHGAYSCQCKKCPVFNCDRTKTCHENIREKGLKERLIRNEGKDISLFL